MKGDFYRYPAFRNKAFVVATALVLLDVFSLGIVLVRRWASVSGEVVYILTLGVLGLLVLWWKVFSTQRMLHRLLERPHSENAEAHPELVAALSVASDIAVNGLFIVSISVSLLLRAAFELSRPR